MSAAPPAAAPSAPLLQVDDVSLTIGSHAILQNVSLRLDDGRALTLIGLNGAGKSTLLRVVLGLQRADAGRVTLRPGTRIGYMPQKLFVDDTLPLTVRRFIQLALPRRLIRRIPWPAGRRHDDRALAVLREVGAAQVLDRPLQSVSGGELQRVLLARALVRDPELLVLDEPVQSVDVAGQYELYDLIVRIRRQRGCAILMVSHDLHLVMPTTDQVICMNHHVCCSGPPDLVTRHPAYLELFGFAPGSGRTLTVYRHHHDHRHDASGEVVADGEPAHARAHTHDGRPAP